MRLVVRLDLLRRAPLSLRCRHLAPQQRLRQHRLDLPLHTRIGSQPAALRLKDRLPNAHVYLSVPNRETFDRLTDHEHLVCQLDGFSMHHRHITEDIMTVLKARDQRIIAWTVNDLTRVNELVRLGVDGITSDNLAILELLGGRERPEPLLSRRAECRVTGAEDGVIHPVGAVSCTGPRREAPS